MANYINISNSLLEVDSKEKLSVDELYLFSYLWTERTYENRVKTSIDFMVEDVALLKKKADNKKRIVEAFESLKEKELINVEEKGKMLIITFTPHKEEGYTGIPYHKVEELNPTDFFIYAQVAKWKDGALYSQLNWAELLDCSVSTAKRDVKKAIEKGVIYKLEGGYNNGWVSAGQLKQDVNTYSVTPILTSVKEEQVKKEVKPAVVDAVPTVEEIEFVEYNIGNWFDKNEFANNKDYDEYLHRKEQANNGDELAKKFVEYCDNRIEGWLNHKNEKVRNIVKEKLREAQERFKTSKNAEKQSNAMVDRYFAELNGDIDYDYTDYHVGQDDDWIKEWAEDEAI